MGLLESRRHQIRLRGVRPTAPPPPGSPNQPSTDLRKVCRKVVNHDEGGELPPWGRHFRARIEESQSFAAPFGSVRNSQRPLLRLRRREGRLAARWGLAPSIAGVSVSFRNSSQRFLSASKRFRILSFI